MVTVFTMILCVILDGQFGLFGPRTPPAVKAIALTTDKKDTLESKSVVQAPSPVVQPQLPALPLPHAHGVYAISNGEIHELEALPGRVPDQRVFMSWAISAPSRKILPDGKIVFVTFRRDLATNPPDRTTVRIIAKIIRAGTFDTAGVANAATVGDTWAIRGISYGLRVAPLRENPEMLVMRPENSDFVFPAGRYGLMVKGRAYDFTVAGPITAAAQCLERIEAARGTFYAECQSP